MWRRAWVLVALLAGPLRPNTHGTALLAAAAEDDEYDQHYDASDDLDLDFDTVGAAPEQPPLHEGPRDHVEEDDVLDEEELNLVQHPKPDSRVWHGPHEGTS
jgi:hypothetical protein